MLKEIISEVADTFRVRSMVRDVIKTIEKNDRGIESADEMTKAVLQKHRTFGNDSMASKELESWKDKDQKSFVNGIVKEYIKKG